LLIAILFHEIIDLPGRWQLSNRLTQLFGIENNNRNVKRVVLRLWELRVRVKPSADFGRRDPRRNLRVERYADAVGKSARRQCAAVKNRSDAISVPEQ
jgi:hypothetical protein